MLEIGKKSKNASIADYGINCKTANWNLSSDNLSDIAVKLNQAQVTSSGAITIDTGEFTGRSPKDRFIVKDEITSNEIWWGDINISFDANKFDVLHKKIIQYLENKEIYVRDCFACADEKYRLSIRVINEYSWSNMFAYNMFIRPTKDEINSFNPEWTILNVPGFMAQPDVDGTRQHNFAILNFTKKIILIGGTGYTGEIKKGIFSALNFILPKYRKMFYQCTAQLTLVKIMIQLYFLDYLELVKQLYQLTLIEN